MTCFLIMLLFTLSICFFIAWAYCLPQNDISSKSISSRDISPIASSSEDGFAPSPQVPTAHEFYVPDELSISIQSDDEFIAADDNDCQKENPMKLQSRQRGACPPSGSTNTKPPSAVSDGFVQRKPNAAPQSTDNKNVCHAPFVHLMCCLASWYYQPAFRGCFTCAFVYFILFQFQS